MSKFVVKSRRGWRWLLAGAAFGGVAVLFMLLTKFGNWADSGLWTEGGWNNKALQAANRDLRAENIQLSEKAIVLEQAANLDKQAASLLTDELKAAQEEIYNLKKELEFYRGVIDAEGNRGWLDVHGMRILPLNHERGYRLELILIHTAKSDKKVACVVEVVLEGVREAGTEYVNLKEITLDKDVVYRFKFGNFRRFENNFALPENFNPQRIFVKLMVEDKKKSEFKRVFDWPANSTREASDVG